jgi:hypothetical protein
MNDDTDVRAMTVNERLAYFQLFGALDAAVASRRLSEVTKVLLDAKLPVEQAHQTAVAILDNPTRYSLG